jgi:hypothetical protein
LSSEETSSMDVSRKRGGLQHEGWARTSSCTAPTPFPVYSQAIPWRKEFEQLEYERKDTVRYWGSRLLAEHVL